MFALAEAIFQMEAGRGSGWEKKFTPAVISAGWDLYLGKETGKVFNFGGVILIGAAVLLYKYFKK
jgi:hypothetical protein